VNHEGRVQDRELALYGIIMALGIPKELQQGIEGFSASDMAGILLKYGQKIVVFE